MLLYIISLLQKIRHEAKAAYSQNLIKLNCYVLMLNLKDDFDEYE